MSDREGFWLLAAVCVAYLLAIGALLPQLTWQMRAVRRLRRAKRRGGWL